MKAAWWMSLACVVAQGAAAQSLQEFAHTGSLALQQQSPLYEAALTADAYKAFARPDLGDLRVYNAAGERVPHALLRSGEVEQEAQAPVRVPYFPIQGTGGRGAQKVVLQTKRGDAGLSATVTMHESGTRGSSVAGYIVDLREHSSAVRGLRLIWTSGAAGTNARVDVFASDDLSTWRTVVRGVPILQLKHGDATLLRDRVEFTALKAKYLRLSWHGEQPPLALTRVDVQPVAAVQERPREWARFAPQAGKRAGEYVYEVGQTLPVDRLRIELLQSDTIAPVSLHRWDDARHAWELVYHFVAYRLGEGQSEVQNPAVKIYARGSRWMLKLDPDVGELGGNMPELHVGWLPHRLVFNARGAAPFTVAFGNPRVLPAALDPAQLIPGYGTDAAPRIADAALGDVQPNARHQTGWLAMLDGKRIALWSALVAAVLLIAVMALRLLRQLPARVEEDGKGRRP